MQKAEILSKKFYTSPFSNGSLKSSMDQISRATGITSENCFLKQPFGVSDNNPKGKYQIKLRSLKKIHYFVVKTVRVFDI